MRYSPTRLAKMRIIMNLQAATEADSRNWWYTWAPFNDFYAMHSFYHKATVNGANKGAIGSSITRYFYHPATGDLHSQYTSNAYDEPLAQINPLVDSVGPAIMVASTCVYLKKGATAQVMVKLTERPADAVTVGCFFRSGDPDISVAAGTVAFTTDDWNRWKPVTIASAASDGDARNRATFALAVTVGTSCLSQIFQAREVVAQPANVLVVVPHSRITVPLGGYAWVPLCLSRDPGGPVTVTLDFPLAPASLAFDSDNWWRWQYAYVAPCGTTDWTAGLTVGGITTTFVVHPVSADAPGMGGGGEMEGMPDLSIDPGSVTQTAFPGQTPEFPLTVTNRGRPGIPLMWNLWNYQIDDSTQSGGPDYAWIEISATGIPVTGLFDDMNVGPFALDRPLTYYGTSFPNFRVCSNGWVSFTDTSATRHNIALPSSYAPRNMLALCWDDLLPDGGGAVYRQQFPDGTLVVEYRDIPFRIDRRKRLTAEIVMKLDGTILLQYQRIDLTDSCTAGIQDASGTRGRNYSYNDGRLRPELAVRFRVLPPWLAMEPMDGSVPGLSQQDVRLTFDATAASPGVHTFQLLIMSNDPTQAEFLLPITFMVGACRGIVMDVPHGCRWQALAPASAEVDDPVDGRQMIRVPGMLDTELAVEPDDNG